MTKRRNKKKVRKSVGIPRSKKMLIELLEIAGGIYETGMNSYRPFRLPKDYRKLAAKGREYQRIKHLEYKKFLKRVKKGDQIFYQITGKGHLDALKSIIISKGEMLPDGDYCLVVFDVPEDIRKVRSAFRNLLKRAGFYQVQKSVWESDREVVEELRMLVRLLKIEEYVTVYRANGPRH